jgi:hypothetical protein
MTLISTLIDADQQPSSSSENQRAISVISVPFFAL